ncbi:MULTISPECIES: YciI family protein [Azorhizobium]|uniref:YCII-related domain-containing protein n=1 Tax=Azorhizobium caulinodans (strain ATCC 43989 / DSM 5975 / JCM 20966 / LMG 6465 / NBRC 14845 / NCIMB 13405 / ORS 571) TaxID=438753 RepID=A8IA17_AZOC5|nr:MULTISPECIES: YciI family protein [Azorhizobium]TDT99615.1 hypothetical protein DFO45_1325 [Azorhizobium sp. AG788]BAF88450.1 conserved hypothetical protein [Azorhizobium caulinodans ORS 571]
MRVMVLVKADVNSEQGALPPAKLLEDMMAYNEELVKAGIMVAGEGLKPSSQGVRIRFSGDQRTVTEGPFAETRELVAGFWIWEVESMAQAVEWAKRCPNPQLSDSDLEIRPFYALSDFGEVVTPEVEAQVERLTAAIEGQHGKYM